MEQAIIVHFSHGSRDLGPLFALEDRLKDAIEREHAGEFDGDEIATDGSDGHLYMYGPDADRLYEVVVRILVGAQFMEGAVVKLRYGPAKSDAREVTKIIGVHRRS